MVMVRLNMCNMLFHHCQLFEKLWQALITLISLFLILLATSIKHNSSITEFLIKNKDNMLEKLSLYA